MSQTAKFQWKFFLIAPLVTAGVLAGLWLALSAAVENVRFARATGQILGIISIARDMNISASANSRQASVSLIERLSQLDLMHVRPPSGKGDLPAPVNPWGNEVAASVMAPERLLQLKMRLSPSICRRMIMFYARDLSSLGLKKVETSDEGLLAAPGRLVYEAGKGETGGIGPAVIQSVCGEGRSVKLTLTFSLQ